MLQVTIMSPEQVLFEGQATKVICPGEQGVFEITALHHSIVSRLLPGLIVIDDQAVPIHRGVVRVADDTVTAIVEPEE